MKKNKKNAKTPRYGVHDVKIETDDVVRTVFPEGALRKLGSLGVNPKIVKYRRGCAFEPVRFESMNRTRDPLHRLNKSVIVTGNYFWEYVI